MMRAYSARIIQNAYAQKWNKSVSKGAGGEFKRATPVKSVVRLMKTTSQLITANMALEGAMSEEEKLTSRTI